MNRAVTIAFDDAAEIADMVADFIRLEWLDDIQRDALGRLADALDEAEAREPNGLFPEPVIVGPSGIEYRVRSRSEDAHD